MASEAEEVVARFINTWPKRNIDALLEFFTDDAVYHNIPAEPARGKAAIRAVINSFLPMASAVEFKVLKSASAGNIVFNERLDIFDMGGKKVELPVAGVFEVRGGKIAAWHDYFDMQMFTKQMG